MIRSRSIARVPLGVWLHLALALLGGLGLFATAGRQWQRLGWSVVAAANLAAVPQAFRRRPGDDPGNSNDRGPSRRTLA